MCWSENDLPEQDERRQAYGLVFVSKKDTRIANELLTSCQKIFSVPSQYC